jgi:hypothetical protein
VVKCAYPSVTVALFLYDLYNMLNMYTIAEFRSNLRQAFEDANQGHEVVIDRYGQKFQLVALVDKPLPGHSFSSSPKKHPQKISSGRSATKGVVGKVEYVEVDEERQAEGLIMEPGTPKTGLESLDKDQFQGPLYRNKKKGKL